MRLYDWNLVITTAADLQGVDTDKHSDDYKVKCDLFSIFLANGNFKMLTLIWWYSSVWSKTS